MLGGFTMHCQSNCRNTSIFIKEKRCGLTYHFGCSSVFVFVFVVIKVLRKMMMQMYLPPWMHVRQFASLEVAPTRNMRIKFRTWRISRYASQLKSKLAPTLTHNFLLFRTQLERTWRGLNRSEIGIKFAKPARTWVTHNVYAVSKPRAHNWVQALQKTFERWYEENCDAAKGKRTPSVAGGIVRVGKLWRRGSGGCCTREERLQLWLFVCTVLQVLELQFSEHKVLPSKA